MSRKRAKKGEKCLFRQRKCKQRQQKRGEIYTLVLKFFSEKVLTKIYTFNIIILSSKTNEYTLNSTESENKEDSFK